LCLFNFRPGGDDVKVHLRGRTDVDSKDPGSR
jgi:hypothetical protein